MMYLFEQKSKNPIAPKWRYFIMQENIFNIDECGEIKSLLILEEDKILKETVDKVKNDGGTGLGETSITSRYMHYNVLNFNYGFVEKLRIRLRDCIKTYMQQYEDFSCTEYYIKSWFNVLRKNQYISKHHHADHPHTFLGGHLTICTENTSTYYEHPFTQEVFKIKNNSGDLILFPNWIKHWTDQYTGDDFRISIAMDITYKNAIDSIPYYPGKEFVNYYVI